ncbi:hypothetical protein O1611_g7846 [Lasiodiplodia mahajangana]|uniref:Uncharacterized protein n=1 Tax=Lasiodiplodia mahajangana TaxID=1108764 RepID=A0ACC2JEJ7_9PEZI|nr:hypothetical protein O1611_g7846 [Lasiodiplodia mahajangana]
MGRVAGRRDSSHCTEEEKIPFEDGKERRVVVISSRVIKMELGDRPHPSSIITKSYNDFKRPRPEKRIIISTPREWLMETFVASMAVLPRLPFSVVPFAIPMFVLVQALVDKGWVILFARWWSAWVSKTGTVGAIAGMGVLSVILSNIAGTNIGATALLCRMLQTWQQMHSGSGSIPDRTWWGAVYALALGVNYGAFSLTLGASLAGLSWREDLAKRGISIRRFEFARINTGIVCFAMAVGCAVLVGQVYITR